MQIEEAFSRISFIKKRWFKKIIFIFVILFLTLPLITFFSFFIINQIPKDFVVNKEFGIKNGMNISQIAEFLEKQKYINSALAFKSIYYYNKFKNNGVPDKIPAGHYIFNS